MKMKSALVIIAIALLASCTKKEDEKRFYTCTYVHSLDLEDFYGTEKEMLEYVEFKKLQKRPVTCK